MAKEEVANQGAHSVFLSAMILIAPVTGLAGLPWGYSTDEPGISLDLQMQLHLASCLADNLSEFRRLDSLPKGYKTFYLFPVGSCSKLFCLPPCCRKSVSLCKCPIVYGPMAVVRKGGKESRQRRNLLKKWRQEEGQCFRLVCVCM